MKKGLGIVFLLLFCISCSNDIDSEIASKKILEPEVSVEDQVIPMVEKQQPAKDTAVEKPKQNTASTPTPKREVTTSNTKQSNDPFGDIFSSGGSGNGSFNGTGLGTATNNAQKLKRTQLTKLDRSPFKIKQSVIIRLQLTIDAKGTVVYALVDADNTYTTDQELLNRVIYAVKKEVKYNSVIDAPLLKVPYEVFIEGTEMPVYVY